VLFYNPRADIEEIEAALEIGNKIKAKN